MSVSYDIDGDGALAQRVRAETGYDDSPDELPQTDLDMLIETAKLQLDAQFRTDIPTFYDDRGLTLALLATVAIKAKAYVENVSVDVWDFDGGRIETRDTTGESFQVAQYEQMLTAGMAAVQTAQRRGPTFQNTHDYIG